MQQRVVLGDLFASGFFLIEDVNDRFQRQCRDCQMHLRNDFAYADLKLEVDDHLVWRRYLDHVRMSFRCSQEEVDSVDGLPAFLQVIDDQFENASNDALFDFRHRTNVVQSLAGAAEQPVDQRKDDLRAHLESGDAIERSQRHCRITSRVRHGGEKFRIAGLRNIFQGEFDDGTQVGRDRRRTVSRETVVHKVQRTDLVLRNSIGAFEVVTLDFLLAYRFHPATPFNMVSTSGTSLASLVRRRRVAFV